MKLLAPSNDLERDNKDPPSYEIATQDTHIKAGLGAQSLSYKNCQTKSKIT